MEAVSYTHLDVYKRQPKSGAPIAETGSSGVRTEYKNGAAESSIAKLTDPNKKTAKSDFFKRKIPLRICYFAFDEGRIIGF